MEYVFIYNKWEIAKNAWGYYLYTTTTDNRYNVYVSKVHRDNTYDFSLDHLYAKSMSLKTATKHLAILNKEVN